MGAITGANAKAGMGITGTFGTADTLTTGDQLDGVTITHSENAEALEVSPIGSGLVMSKTVDRGNVAPTIQIEGPMGYEDPKIIALAQMFGGASFMSLGSGAYVHSLIPSETANQKFLTVAWQAHSASAGTFEYPSAVCRGATITASDPNQYVNILLDLLGDEQKISGQTNTYTGLNSVTAANSRRIVFKNSDEFWINSQSGGALSSGDRLNITSMTIEYQRPQEHAREAKGSTSLGVPVATGEFPWITGITITCRTLADFTYFTAHKDETEYKALATITGATIGGGFSHTFQPLFPRLKIVESPESSLTEAGNNNLTVRFAAVAAASAATGMPISIYPHIRVISTRSTSLLA